MAETYRAVVFRLATNVERLPLSTLHRDMCHGEDRICLWDWRRDSVAWIAETTLAQHCTDALWRHDELARKHLGQGLDFVVEPLVESPVLSFQVTRFRNELGEEKGGYLQWVRHLGGSKARYIGAPANWRSRRHLRIHSDRVGTPGNYSWSGSYDTATERSWVRFFALCKAWGVPAPKYLSGNAIVDDRDNDALDADMVGDHPDGKQSLLDRDEERARAYLAQQVADLLK